MAFLWGNSHAQSMEILCGSPKEFADITKDNGEMLVATGKSLQEKNATTYIWHNPETNSYSILIKFNNSDKVCAIDGGKNFKILKKVST
jgi:hypothetical protein